MPKNDDLINDILRELDTPSQPAPEPEITPAPEEELSAIPQDDYSQNYDDYTAYESENYNDPAEQYPYEDPQPQDAMNPDDMYYQQEMYPQYEYDAPPQRMAPRKKKKRRRKRNRLPGVLILTTLIFAVSIILSMAHKGGSS